MRGEDNRSSISSSRSLRGGISNIPTAHRHPRYVTWLIILTLAVVYPSRGTLHYIPPSSPPTTTTSTSLPECVVVFCVPVSHVWICVSVSEFVSEYSVHLSTRVRVCSWNNWVSEWVDMCVVLCCVVLCCVVASHTDVQTSLHVVLLLLLFPLVLPSSAFTTCSTIHCTHIHRHDDVRQCGFITDEWWADTSQTQWKTAYKHSSPGSTPHTSTSTLTAKGFLQIISSSVSITVNGARVVVTYCVHVTATSFHGHVILCHISWSRHFMSHFMVTSFYVTFHGHVILCHISWSRHFMSHFIVTTLRRHVVWHIALRTSREIPRTGHRSRDSGQLTWWRDTWRINNVTSCSRLFTWHTGDSNVGLAEEAGLQSGRRQE